VTGLDYVAAAAAFGVTPGAQQMRMSWGILQSNNTDGTAVVRLAGSQTDLTVPYATAYPAKPGAKVGVVANGPDVAITHIMAPSAIPVARVSRRVAPQSITSGVTTDIVFDTEDSDPWDLWNGSSTFTVPVAGVYTFGGGVVYAAANTTGHRSAFLYKNGTIVAFARDSAPNATNPNVVGLPGGVILCEAGDTIKMGVQQTSGVAVNVNSATTYDCWLSLAWVGWQGPTQVYGPELMENAGAEALSLVGHSSFWGSFTAPTVTTTAGEFSTGAAGFKNVFSGSGYWVFQGIPVAVRPGDVYRFQTTVKSSVATAGTAASSAWIEVLYSADDDDPNYFDATVLAETVLSYTTTTTSFKTISAEWTIPDGVYWIRPSWRFVHTAAITFFVDECSVKKKDLT
jgi:hypothetical protein